MKCTESKMPHYGLRKLPIGVASVLLGMSAAVITGHADSAVNNSKNTSVAASVNGDNINNSYQEKSQSSAINSDSNTESTSEVATNAQQLSASGSENNSISNSVNVQGASSVINSYSDNKISVQDSNQNDNVAKNVKADWYWDGQKVNDQVTTEETIGWSTRRMGMDFEFDVDGNQLKNGNMIDIAKITQTSDNSGMTAFDYENTSVPVSINGQSIGTIDLTT